MSLDTKYNWYNYNASGVSVSREPYSNVGSSQFQIGISARNFDATTGFEIWDSPTGGTQLIENTDYVLENTISTLTAAAGYTVKNRVRVTNATYQTGNIYITHRVVSSEADAVAIQNLNTLVTETFTVGSLGHFANLQDVANFLENKSITGAVTAKLIENQTSGLSISNFNKNLIIDLAGYSITVPSGNAIAVSSNSYLKIENSTGTSNITTGTTGTGFGISCSINSTVSCVPTSSIVIGANGAAFANGILADKNSMVNVPSANVTCDYNTSNYICRQSVIQMNNAIATNGTTDIACSQGGYVYAAGATYTVTNPAINTMTGRAYIEV